MTSDLPIESGLTLGDWLQRELAEECYFETASWATERVRRAEDRLQEGRPAAELLETVVLWSAWANAFTAPGKYIYFARPLLERCPHDEAAAFVIAHEIAHHDLGHVCLLPSWLAGLARVSGAWVAAALVHGLERRLYGPERECAADLHGLELCIRAGYDPYRCLEVLNVLELYALDHGDHEMVYGPDPESDEELFEDASWKTRIRIWAWQRMRGYLPIQDRRALLLRHLAGPGNQTLVSSASAKAAGPSSLSKRRSQPLLSSASFDCSSTRIRSAAAK